MNKNNNLLFLSLTLIILLVSISSVSAVDLNDNTTITDNTDNVEEVEITKYSDNKNLLTDNQEVNYYVSDSSGNDNNPGTQDSPFKTIQTALDKTDADATYNIYIQSGTYKGLGNTNLTVNGENIINIIGSGINQTVIDGEAKYDIDTSQFTWDSSGIWAYYTNESGNYGMNITKGNGHITLSQMTIQNCYSLGINGGSSISLYPTATVDNYGNLTVNTVYFYNNYAGVGAGIRNNLNSTLLVNNSIFKGNRKSSSTGNYGSGVYNNATATITNSIFDENYARWCVVMNDNTLIVGNCTFQNGIDYDGGSLYKYGSGIGANTGQSDYFFETNLPTYTLIENSTFINNKQTDFWGAKGVIIINNNTFINSTRIYLSDDTINENYTYTVTNNKFFDTRASSLKVSLSTGTDICTIESAITNNTLIIENNTFNNINGTTIKSLIGNINNNNISYSLSGTALSLTTKAKATNNQINNGNIEFWGQNNQIINNNITSNETSIKFRTSESINNLIINNTIISNDTYAISLYRTAYGSNITDNYILSKSYVGDSAVELFSGDNTVENNLPEIPQNAIYVSANAPVNEGTINNPTSLSDGLSKLNDEINTIYLLNTDGDYIFNEPITIKDISTKNINIIGLTQATISGNNLSQILNVAEGYNITLSNISFVDSVSEYGGAIYTEGNITVKNSAFNNNKATVAGGAIYANKNANIILTNNTFTDIISGNETIYFNSTGNIYLNNNQYQNCDINLVNFIITADEDNPNPVKVNDIIKFNIGTITLANPTWYDSNITSSTIEIYKNDEIIDTITDKTYNINILTPETVTTKVKPTFTTETSNTISTDIDLTIIIRTKINLNNITGFINENIIINPTIIDEFNLTVDRGTIYYYKNSTLIGLSEVIDGTSTFQISSPTEESNLLTLVYNDTTRKYAGNNKTVRLAVLDDIYASPNATEASGLKEDPTTITDALNKVRDGKKIILLEGTYNINSTLTISSSTVNARNFSIIGENSNIILDGGNKIQIMTIDNSKTIYIENITFTNSLVSNNRGTINNAGNLTLNNTQFVKTSGGRGPGAVYNDRGILNIYNSVFSENIGTSNGAVLLSIGLLNIDNCTFNNNKNTAANGIIYSNNNNSIISNSIFIDNVARTSVIASVSSNLSFINNIVENNEITTQGMIYISGLTYGVDNDLEFIMDNNKIINNKVTTTAAIAYINGHVNAQIKDNLFENNTARSGGIYATNSVSKINLTNNTYKNIETTDETNYLLGTSITLNNNTYENCTIQYTANLTITDNTKKPINVNDAVEIMENITLTHPTYYDDTILDEYTFISYMDNEEIETIEESNTYTIYPNHIGDVKTNIKPSFVANKSNELIVDVQIGNLKNTVIICQPSTYEFNQTTVITVNVTDKENNPVEDGGIVSLYYEDGTFIAQNNTINGIATIITPIIDKSGTNLINILYNINDTYNNQTNITYITGTMKDVYVSPDVETIQTGSKDNPTTILDALTKIGNNGTIHFLKGLSGIYYINETIPLTTLLPYGTFSYTLNGEEENIVLFANGQHSIFTTKKSDNSIIISNLTLTNPNSNAAQGSIISSNYINLTVINCLVENTSAGVQGGFIYNRGLLNIINCTFNNLSANSDGGVIYDYGGTVNIHNSTFNNTQARSQGGVIYGQTGKLFMENSIITNINADRSGAIYIMNGDNPCILINNTFQNITTTRDYGLIYGNSRNLSLINNTLINIKALSETNYLIYNPINITGNTYSNCTIATNDLTITLDSEETSFKVGDNVTITINNITLNRPASYDEDILEKMNYELYINDEINQETQENPATIILNKEGTITIYAKTSFGDKISNNITLNVVKHETTMTVNPLVVEVGDTINLTAHLTDENENPINTGKVIFKVGGATIKGSDGKALYAQVTNGTAQITYTVPKGWTKENTIIEAIYSENSKYTSARANSTITATYKQASIQIINDQTAKMGSTTNIIAIVKDNNNKLINTGSVIFKLNGITLKDENGKIIKAEIKDGIAQTSYTITTGSIQNYTITAVFTDSNYERTEANSTIEIIKSGTFTDIEIIKVTDNKTGILSGKIYGENGQPVQRAFKVTVKINGITFINKATVNNGIINITLDKSISNSTSIEKFKPNKIYDVLVIIGDNTQYYGTNKTTVLVKE